jgi:uncharacterized membrane protein YczE
MKQDTTVKTMPALSRACLLVWRGVATIPGLAVCAFGIWMTLQADIGLGPWDALTMGLANRFGTTYGTFSITIALVVLVSDVFLHECIGIGTVLNCFLIGSFVDVYNAIGLSAETDSLILRVLLMIGGMFVLGFGQYLYMKVGLGCGPRDSLVVGLGRYVPKVPIGAVNIAVLAAVLLIAWLLNGPIGFGTLLFAFGSGVAMQIVFRIVHFEPRDVVHQDLLQSLHFLFGETA